MLETPILFTIVLELFLFVPFCIASLFLKFFCIFMGEFN